MNAPARPTLDTLRARGLVPEALTIPCPPPGPTLEDAARLGKALAKQLWDEHAAGGKLPAVYALDDVLHNPGQDLFESEWSDREIAALPNAEELRTALIAAAEEYWQDLYS